MNEENSPLERRKIVEVYTTDECSRVIVPSIDGGEQSTIPYYKDRPRAQTNG